jgi:cholinesterase
MRTLLGFLTGAVVYAMLVISAQAQSYTSLYVFGDALSTTTNNTYYSVQNPKWYYGQRFSNGRVWVEVLAQRQGIPIANNWSYFDDNSGCLETNVKNFSGTIPPTALVVVWCNNSDLFDQAINGSTSVSQWTTNLNQDITNYVYNDITELYKKGARTLIMPNAVDVGEVPGFDLSDQPSYLNFIRQECIAYNVLFTNTINKVLANPNYPGLTIYVPDFFSLLDNVLTNAGSYGLTNALEYGEPIDATDALGKSCNTNGLGDNYVFWDDLDPTAKFHEIIADTVQQQISPAQIGALTVLASQSQPATPGQQQASTTVPSVFNAGNLPVGLSGFVDGTTNMGQGGFAWITITNFNSTSPSQSLYVNTPPIPLIVSVGGYGSIYPNGGGGGTVTNAPGYIQAFRLRFPFTWSWP